MHELGIVFHIIRTVEDVARQNDVTRIRRVTLQLVASVDLTDGILRKV